MRKWLEYGAPYSSNNLSQQLCADQNRHEAWANETNASKLERLIGERLKRGEKGGRETLQLHGRSLSWSNWLFYK